MASSFCVTLIIVAWISAAFCAPLPNSTSEIYKNDTENKLKTDPNSTQWLKPSAEHTASESGGSGSSSDPKEGTSGHQPEGNPSETIGNAPGVATPFAQALQTTSLSPGVQVPKSLGQGSSNSTPVSTTTPEGSYSTAVATTKHEGSNSTAVPTTKSEGSNSTSAPTTNPEGGNSTAGITKPENNSEQQNPTVSEPVNEHAETPKKPVDGSSENDSEQQNPTPSEPVNKHFENGNPSGKETTTRMAIQENGGNKHFENGNPSGKETTTRMAIQENGGNEKIGDGQAMEEDVETESSGHFMAYFLTAVVLCIAGYVIFHNKQKIIAFIVEGRGGRQRRRLNGAEYKKLQSNMEEVTPALDKTTAAKNFIY